MVVGAIGPDPVTIELHEHLLARGETSKVQARNRVVGCFRLLLVVICQSWPVSFFTSGLGSRPIASAAAATSSATATRVGWIATS